MRRRVPHIPQRKLLYLGCEGESEKGYADLIQGLARARGLPVHIHVDVLSPGAGDPLARVELAIDRIKRFEKNRAPLPKRFLLLDDDQTPLAPERAQKARRLAVANRIRLIWQSPCHEALILRHLSGFDRNRPPDARSSEQALLREWPEYRKPMERAELERRLDVESLIRIAAVENELAEFLKAVGLVG